MLHIYFNDTAISHVEAYFVNNRECKQEELMAKFSGEANADRRLTV